MRVRPFWVILLTVMEMRMCCCLVDSNSSETYLIRQILMTGYDPLARPVANSSQQIFLNLSMGLKGFIELDMKKQTLVSFGWLTVTWYDHFLRWDRNQYPFQEVHLKMDMVWRPDLVIYNTVSELDQLEDQKIKVIVEHTGKVVWYPGGLFKTFCSINIFHYPLDIQTCSVEITTWTYTHATLNVTFGDPAFESAEGVDGHPEWTLISKKTGYILWPTSYWDVKFIYTMKRKVIFYVLNMILPIMLLSLLNSMVFLLPADSGEKMTVSVTIFLSFTIFLSVINNSLPANSNSVCLFSMYVAVEMFVSVCSIFMAACIVSIYDKEKDSHTAPQKELSDLSEEKMFFSVMSKPFRNNRPNFANSQMHYSTTNHFIGSTLFSGNSGFPQSSTVSGTKNENRDCPSGAEEVSGRLPIKRVWSLAMRFQHLKPHERRLLSQQLDAICFQLFFSINTCICFTFCLIWIFA